jgi:hypothetical protein
MHSVDELGLTPAFTHPLKIAGFSFIEPLIRYMNLFCTNDEEAILFLKGLRRIDGIRAPKILEALKNHKLNTQSF